jgi:hypothetical protein
MTIETIELKANPHQSEVRERHKNICDGYKVLRAKYCEASNAEIERTLAELIGITQQGVDRVLRKYNVLVRATKRARKRAK